jgi:hypothetical protein
VGSGYCPGVEVPVLRTMTADSSTLSTVVHWRHYESLSGRGAGLAAVALAPAGTWHLRLKGSGGARPRLSQYGDSQRGYV